MSRYLDDAVVGPHDDIGVGVFAVATAVLQRAPVVVHLRGRFNIEGKISPY